jgi:hypothetical protein
MLSLSVMRKEKDTVLFKWSQYSKANDKFNLFARILKLILYSTWLLILVSICNLSVNERISIYAFCDVYAYTYVTKTNHLISYTILIYFYKKKIIRTIEFYNKKNIFYLLLPCLTIQIPPYLLLLLLLSQCVFIFKFICKIYI